MQAVVILCRMDAGWKAVSGGTLAYKYFVVILCRMDAGWKDFNGTFTYSNIMS